MSADPAEAPRRGSLVLLLRYRLHGASRRLCDLSAAPERERDRGRYQRVELEARGYHREHEEDEEECHQDRQASPYFDVEADHGSRRKEPDRKQRAECHTDQEASCQRDRGDLKRASQPYLEHVAENWLGPIRKEAHRASSGRARRRSTTRIEADIVQTMTRSVNRR